MHTNKPPQRKGLVVNLSSYTLNQDEKKVLSLGLNYAIPHKALPVKEIIASTEQTSKFLNHSTAQELREKVKSCIENYKPPRRSNLDKKQFQAISDLKHNNSIVILPADKGNKTVVMDKSEYKEKIVNLLDDKAYCKLKRDPTTTTDRKISETLKDLQKNGEIDEKLRSKITPQHSYLPQLYGLPKLHKPNIPLRPIVSSIGSTTYQLAKELTRVLSPLRGQTDSYIKNSHHFVQKISSLSLGSTDIMVSFDVKSLFTKVPIVECLDIIKQRLEEDDTLADRTLMTPLTITNLVKRCMDSTFFGFDDEIYEQVEGAPMGSPLSPVIADLYMEFFLNRWLLRQVNLNLIYGIGM